MFLQTPHQGIAGNYLSILDYGCLFCFQKEDSILLPEMLKTNMLLSCQGACVCSGLSSCFVRKEHDRLHTVCPLL